MPATPLYRRPVPRATLEELRRLYYQCKLQECYDRGQAILDTAAGLPDREPGDGEVPLEMVVEVVLQADSILRQSGGGFWEAPRRFIKQGCLSPDGFYMEYLKIAHLQNKGHPLQDVINRLTAIRDEVGDDRFRLALVDTVIVNARRYLDPLVAINEQNDFIQELLAEGNIPRYILMNSHLANTYCLLGHYREAESIARHLLKMCIHLQFRWGIHLALLNLMLSLVRTGRFREAIEVDDRYRMHFQSNPVTMAGIVLLKGNALVGIGHFDEAEEQYRESLEISRRGGLIRNAALVLDSLCDLSLLRGDVDSAAHYCEHAMVLYRERTGYRGDLAGALRRLGCVHNARGEHEQAIQVLTEAIGMAEETAEMYELGVAYRAIAKAYRHTARLDDALTAARKSVRLLDKMGARYEQVLSDLELGHVALAKMETTEQKDQPEGTLSPYEVAWGAVTEAYRLISEYDMSSYLETCHAMLERLRRLRRTNSLLSLPSHSQPRLIARSAAMQDVLKWITIASESEDPVLITGESGTGKEVVARTIHARSQRRHGPFVVVNCGAIPSTLFEREFFGHAPGAYTGSGEGAPGLLEQAEGGTLLLDEICDLALPLQAKLLRVIQDGTYRRLGDPEKRHADVRFMAASIEHLGRLVREERFRADLYYRLQSVEISLPPLRERMEDLAPLITRFLEQLLDETPDPRRLFPDDVWQALHRYRWPGNVREVESVMRRLAVLYRHHGRVSLEMLPEEILGGVPSSGHHTFPTIEQRVREMERQAIREALIVAGGNRTEAARLLGVSRQNLYKMVKRLGITPDMNGLSDQAVD